MKKRALISVFDKTGILEFAKFLKEKNIEIVSTGGTYKYLKENGLEVIEISEVKTVIDADGLRLFREIIEEKENRKLDLKKDLRTGFVLTPHIKELADLLYLSKEDVKDDIIGIAEELKYCSGMVVIKEARTVVVGEGRCYINDSGNSAMAKAGSGDVLTGIISALMVGDKLRPFMMVALGVYIHGLAGDILKEKKGNHGILAKELADEAAEVMKRYA